MTRIIMCLVVLVSLVIAGCSSGEKDSQVSPAVPSEQVKALSLADKEKIATFEKELFDLEKISGKAVDLVGNEVKQVMTGKKESVDLAVLVEAAKGEARQSLDNLAAKAVPDKLPPWFSRNLTDAKKGFSEAFKARIESFESLKKVMEEKSLTAMLEYKQKSALADRLFKDSRDRIALVLKASGLQAKEDETAGAKPGK